MQLATIEARAHYWLNDYDWRRCEAELNALPLVMTHGWPGSVIELLQSVGPLTDPTAHGGSPEDPFHLVLPSIPGYGYFLEQATRPQTIGYALLDPPVARAGDFGEFRTERGANPARSAVTADVAALAAGDPGTGWMRRIGASVHKRRSGGGQPRPVVHGTSAQ